MKTLKKQPRLMLTITFTAIVFLILIITMVIVVGSTLILTQTGIFDIKFPNMLLPFVVIALISILIGTIVAAFISGIPIRPINKLISGMNTLSSGDYDVKLTLGTTPVEQQISESFNDLASELRCTEMLRSDFVNNFSHEFKTPIVSIRGFAKLIKKGNLSEEQKTEYLDIIYDESARLAEMATNVLDLTKIENQNILTNITSFNLSEQIRTCVLLLEKKWSRKEIEINMDLEEHQIKANDELLKQVWINLIDNAIKFSPENSEIRITISDTPHDISVSIKNKGEKISYEDINRIFQKFYQCDTSHANEGTGVGLAIVKRIVDLHGGTINVNSTSNDTEFIVNLSKEQ